MHRTTTALLATALLGAALLPTTPTAAAAPTCRGQAVTIDSAGAALVTGTEGNDVIHADGAGEVVALGGDDLVCVTGRADTTVRAGAGNDVVDATAAAGGTTTFLGEGDDTYAGSAAYDDVLAGTAPGADTGRDVVDTGVAGTLADTVFTGERGQPNPDEVRGGHLDVDWHGIATGAGVLAGGADSMLRVQPESWGMSINADLGVLASTRWPSDQAISGFSRFSVTAHRDLTRLTFRGSDRAESLDVDGLRSTTLFQVGMGRGDDVLDVISFDKTHRNASFSGGRGTDRISLVMPRVADVDLDLRRGRLSTGRGTGEEDISARGFEDAIVVAPDVELVGTARSNDLRVDACRATARGLGSKDAITTFVGGGSYLGPVRCREGRRFRFAGDGGADTLVGGNGRDHLVGGPGRDEVDGARGRDVCQGERLRRCEERR